MDRVIAALKRAGVEDRDIQTSNISLNPEYTYAEQSAAKAQRLYGLEPADDPLPRHRQLGENPRCPGRRGRQPDQRAQPDHRQARSGARRSAGEGGRRRARTGRALRSFAGDARRARGGGQRERRQLSGAAADADDDARAAAQAADTKIVPGEQKLSVTLSDDLRAAISGHEKGRAGDAARPSHLIDVSAS